MEGHGRSRKVMEVHDRSWKDMVGQQWSAKVNKGQLGSQFNQFKQTDRQTNMVRYRAAQGS